MPGEASRLADFKPDRILAKSMGTLVACYAHAQCGLTADYAGSFEQMQELTQDCANCERVEIPGSDHVYGDFDTLVPLIRSWLGITPPPS